MKTLIIVVFVLAILGGCYYMIPAKPPCIEYKTTIEYSPVFKQVMPKEVCIKREGE